MSKKYFHEVWAEEEELLKLGLEVSRRNKAERFNKSPGKKLVDEIEGRNKPEPKDDFEIEVVDDRPEEDTADIDEEDIYDDLDPVDENDD